jgi:hypothetical protein
LYYLILQEEERNGDVRQTPWAKVDKTVLSKRVSPPPSKEEGKTVHPKRVSPPPSKEEVTDAGRQVMAKAHIAFDKVS